MVGPLDNKAPEPQWKPKGPIDVKERLVDLGQFGTVECPEGSTIVIFSNDAVRFPRFGCSITGSE